MLDTPIGDLSVAVDDVGVCGVRFGRVDAPVVGGPSLADDELRAYFAGELDDFTVRLSVHGGTAFERAVWTELTRIPYGETRTYGQVAAAVSDAGASRAVGVACNRNPIPVIVPCHRVVGASGLLVGYGGGLDRKRALLDLESQRLF